LIRMINVKCSDIEENYEGEKFVFYISNKYETAEKLSVLSADISLEMSCAISCQK